MNQTKGYVDVNYLQTTADMLQAFKKRSYELMNVKPGQQVLDVGCGPASDTLALADLVGSTGQVFGVDFDPEMVAEAEYRALQAGVSGWVRHIHGETFDMPFEDGQFDSSRSERVFQHLKNPELALAEMVRVTKPGGRVVVWDADWGTLSIDTKEVDVERKLVRLMTELTVHNGYSGRQLYRLLKQQSLTVLSYEANTLFFDNYELMRTIVGFDYTEQEALATSAISREELERWHADLEQADRKGLFFGSVTGILIAGEKPGR